MSDLQIGLIVIGVLIILAILAVNWWQERKFHQQIESNFSPLQSDVLLEDFVADENLDAQKSNNANPYVANIHDKIAIDTVDDFPFDKSLSDVEFSFNIDAINDVKADFILPPTDTNFDEKSAQHHDTKTIIEDAFNHARKADPERDYSPLATKEVISHQASTSDDVSTNDKAFVDTHFQDANDISDLNKTEFTEPEISLPSMLNNQIDLTAILYLAVETPLTTLFSTLASLLNSYDKPVFVHILQSKNPVNNAANQDWYALNSALPDQLVSKVACSLQLADRAGAVSRSILNRFQLAVETIGLDINAHVEWQTSSDALTAATALDSFCIDVDKTIGFHLVHGENGVFTGTKLRGLAEAQGFTLSSEGMFRYFDASSNEASFIMFNREDHLFSAEMLRTSVVKGVTFQFDIPHIKQCAQAFSQMVQVARQMEIGLNAVLVDDNNKVLGDIQIEKIRQQLKVIHATMLVRGIVPGSDSALRLFS